MKIWMVEIFTNEQSVEEIKKKVHFLRSSLIKASDTEKEKCDIDE